VLEKRLSFLDIFIDVIRAISALMRGNIGITISDKVARGRARRVSVIDHSRARGGINNISKEPQQKGRLKGGLKTI